MNIRFYSPDHEIIPTGLRLHVDYGNLKGIPVFYKSIPLRFDSRFGYHFEIFLVNGVTKDIAREIFSHILQTLITQSCRYYDKRWIPIEHKTWEEDRVTMNYRVFFKEAEEKENE